MDKITIFLDKIKEIKVPEMLIVSQAFEFYF